MNFISGIPMMFAFVMSTGGPEAAFANWTMVGGFSFIVSLAMAEIASALPVAGGIYYWSFYLGGKKWGPFLSWMSAVIATISSVWICYLFVVLLLPQVYPVTGTTLNYAPVMIGAITLISLVGWVFPFGLGGKYWFKGPQTTITDVDVLEATIPDMS
ncbi:hypothetical protein TsFJ059_009114 [Trichoderma semiorbis]|uniref:Amino acid transporter n=1 Tax=Trichoderma semiorbis TaxID=1491008 RepID=A0A9P8HNB6_9HYPO|nr:hypothetical protein TsFJ059_009114 [Trichoderma semiorbis]